MCVWFSILMLLLCFFEPNLTASLTRDEAICINNYKCLRRNQIEDPNKLDKVSSFSNVWKLLKIVFQFTIFFRFAEILIHLFAIAAEEPKITSNMEKSVGDFALLKS